MPAATVGAGRGPSSGEVLHGMFDGVIAAAMLPGLFVVQGRIHQPAELRRRLRGMQPREKRQDPHLWLAILESKGCARNFTASNVVALSLLQ